MVLTKEECKKQMKRQGLSGKALCDKAGISTYTLSMWLRGLTDPKVETKNKIASALGLEQEPMRPVIAFEHEVPTAPLIPRISPHLIGEAARVMGVYPAQIRRYILRGAQWGHVIGEGERRTFYIDREKFYNTFGVILEIPERKKKGEGNEEISKMDIAIDREGSSYYSDIFLHRNDQL